jgi:hypothetical protein
MSQPVRLAGIAWDHSRALPPLVAVAQRYEETHPGVRILHRPAGVLARPASGFANLVDEHLPQAGEVRLGELLIDSFVASDAIAKVVNDSGNRIEPTEAVVERIAHFSPSSILLHRSTSLERLPTTKTIGRCVEDVKS